MLGQRQARTQYYEQIKLKIYWVKDTYNQNVNLYLTRTRRPTAIMITAVAAVSSRVTNVN